MVSRAGLPLSIMETIKILVTLLVLFLMAPAGVLAGYTNICGGATYRCDANCSESSGVCTASYVVKWICNSSQSECGGMGPRRFLNHGGVHRM